MAVNDIKMTLKVENKEEILKDIDEIRNAFEELIETVEKFPKGISFESHREGEVETIKVIYDTHLTANDLKKVLTDVYNSLTPSDDVLNASSKRNGGIKYDGSEAYKFNKSK